MKKESLKNVAGITFLYLLIIFGVIIVNARFEYLNSSGTANGVMALPE